MACYRVPLCRENAIIDVHIVHCVTPEATSVGVGSGVKGCLPSTAQYEVWETAVQRFTTY